METKFIVAGYTAESTETKYDEGEAPGGAGAFWSNRDCPVRDGLFDSVEDALKAVCKANCFDYRAGMFFYDEDGGRFFADVMVDVENSEASEAEIEAWRDGKMRLWDCFLSVEVARQSVPEPIRAEDVLDFPKY